MNDSRRQHWSFCVNWASARSTCQPSVAGRSDLHCSPECSRSTCRFLSDRVVQHRQLSGQCFLGHRTTPDESYLLYPVNTDQTHFRGKGYTVCQLEKIQYDESVTYSFIPSVYSNLQQSWSFLYIKLTEKTPCQPV